MNNKIENSYTTKEAIKYVFRNSLFIMFSFINLFIPFYATIISSLDGPNGILYVVASGLSTSFITIFNQFLFLLSLSIIFVYKQINKNESIANKNIKESIFIIMIFSFIAIILFIITSFLYINFSAAYANLHKSINLGFEYILIIAFSLLFNGFIYLEIMNVHTYNKKRAWTLMVIFFLLNLLLIPLIGIEANWKENFKTFGIGLGILVSSFLTLLIIILNRYKIIFNKNRFEWKNIKMFFLSIRNFVANFLLSTLMKSILVMVIALSIGLSQKDSPIGLFVSKIIWYNSLFFCGFFADGLLYTMEYTRLSLYMNNKNDLNIIDYKVLNRISLIGILATIIICVVFDACAMPLAKLYCHNQIIPLESPFPSGVWPYENNISLEAQKYLWTTNGVYNFKIPTPNGFEESKAFCLMYTTIYHVLINSTKLISIGELKIHEKFSLKKLVSNFITIAIVMIFVVVFSIVPNSDQFNKTFPGLDSFSFALMSISFILFLLTILGYFKKAKNN